MCYPNSTNFIRSTVLHSAGVWEILLWLLRRRRRFRVVGLSMFPLLYPGEEVLVNPYAYGDRLPQPGDIVVAEHPQRPGFRLIKRIIAIPEPATRLGSGYWLEGDNVQESTDSRTFGLVPDHCIVGQVTCLLFPQEK